MSAVPVVKRQTNDDGVNDHHGPCYGVRERVPVWAHGECLRERPPPRGRHYEKHQSTAIDFAVEHVIGESEYRDTEEGA